MAHAPFYSDGFPQSIFIMEDASALDKCLDDLAKHKLRGWLIPALKAHAAALAAGGVQPVAPATPLKRLLEPPPPEPEPLLEATDALVAYGSGDGKGAGGEGGLGAGPKATDATDATTDGNANPEGVDPTSECTTTNDAEVPTEQDQDPKQPSRASSRRPPPPAEPSLPKRQQQPKSFKRARNDTNHGVSASKVGRPKLFPDIGEGATVQQSDRMLAKSKELTAANEKFQGTISSLNEQLVVAKAGKGAEVDELKAKLQAQEVQIATLKTTVEYSGKLHDAFMTGLTMQRPGAAFASPASSASTATPPPHAGGIGGLFHPLGVD